MKTNTTILKIVFVVAASAALWMSSGCGPQRRDEPFTRSLQSDDPRVAGGQRVFSQHCYQCHPGGAAGLGPAMNDKPLPVTAMKAQVRQGLGAMPAFSKREIDDGQLEDLMRYLKALRAL